jgi:hypothetical protein
MSIARHLLAASLLLMTCGCAEYWAKPGGTQAELNMVTANCHAQSHAQFPPVLQTVQSSAGYTTPAKTNCTSSGNNSVNCTTKGGDYVPPSYQTVDVNDNGRDAAFHACMYNAGWQSFDSEEQATAVTRSAPPRPMQALPR